MTIYDDTEKRATRDVTLYFRAMGHKKIEIVPPENVFLILQYIARHQSRYISEILDSMARGTCYGDFFALYSTNPEHLEAHT